jgi:succinyl-diaminopimelate desuccinylase
VTPAEAEVLREVERLTPEIVGLTQALVRIPTINPPGDCYADCAELIARTLRDLGYSVETLAPIGLPEHSERHPRINVVGKLGSQGEVLHFNGHYDVVPPGSGWSADPFSAAVRDDAIFGRGSCDQKAGIAASIYAVEAVRRAGVELNGSIEQSATPDEESGGFAGVAWLCDSGRISSDKQRWVVITEPLDPERVAIGHRGVYWFELTTFGRTGHGSMPTLGQNAAEQMTRLIRAIQDEYKPRLAERMSRAPVEPPEARTPSISLNALHAGQPLDVWQSPCVPDRCTAVFDRRFIHEESLSDVRAELREFLASTGIQHELRELMHVDPLLLSRDGVLAQATGAAIRDALNTEAKSIVSPGTFDQKHVVRRGGISECVGYGPGRLVLAHQPDEHVRIDDIVAATKVMALLTLRLLGAG